LFCNAAEKKVGLERDTSACGIRLPNDVCLLGENLNTVKKDKKFLSDAGLEVNTKQTKSMFKPHNQTVTPLYTKKANNPLKRGNVQIFGTDCHKSKLRSGRRQEKPDAKLACSPGGPGQWMFEN
jgi:hypothetical protein